VSGQQNPRLLRDTFDLTPDRADVDAQVLEVGANVGVAAPDIAKNEAVRQHLPGMRDQ
jgi:hypothetical protein